MLDEHHIVEATDNIVAEHTLHKGCLAGNLARQDCHEVLYDLGAEEGRLFGGVHGHDFVDVSDKVCLTHCTLDNLLPLWRIWVVEEAKEDCLVVP